MNVVGESFHVGKALVGMQFAVRIALALPRIVDIHVQIARLAHAGADQQVRRRPDIRSGHALGKMVPAIPAHRRQCSDARLAETRGAADKSCTRQGGDASHPGYPHRSHVLRIHFPARLQSITSNDTPCLGSAKAIFPAPRLRCNAAASARVPSSLACNSCA